VTLLLIRPDSWNLPLLLHVGGAMALVASVTVAAVALLQGWRAGEDAALRRHPVVLRHAHRGGMDRLARGA
jgi:hypothetical protein